MVHAIAMLVISTFIVVYYNFLFSVCVYVCAFSPCDAFCERVSINQKTDSDFWYN